MIINLEYKKANILFQHSILDYKLGTGVTGQTVSKAQINMRNTGLEGFLTAELLSTFKMEQAPECPRGGYDSQQ